MILVNLLPDLRQAKLRDSRRRQLVSGVSVLVWIVCGGLVAILALYWLGQNAYIAKTTSDIKQKESDLRSMPDLIPAMTAQQHLSSLSSLYGQRVYFSKFFEAYTEADPVDVVLTGMSVDSSNVLTVLGNAPTYAEVAKVARALEACNIKVCAGAAKGNSPYFSNVNITTVGSSAKGNVTFTLTATLESGVTSNASE